MPKAVFKPKKVGNNETKIKDTTKQESFSDKLSISKKEKRKLKRQKLIESMKDYNFYY